jgi:hypothetical protein
MKAISIVPQNNLGFVLRLTPYPQAGESAEGLLHPPPESEILDMFGKYELR